MSDVIFSYVSLFFMFSFRKKTENIDCGPPEKQNIDIGHREKWEIDCRVSTHADRGREGP